MGITERQEAEKIALKQKIFDAAVEIINEAGYENLSIRKIADKIEYSTSVIYGCYKDKAAILQDILVNFYYDVVKSVIADLQKMPRLSPKEHMKSFMRFYILAMIHEPGKVKAIRSTGFEFFTSQLPDDTALKYFEGILLEGEQAGAYKKIQSHYILIALTGFVHYIVDNNMFNEDGLMSSIESYADYLLGGLLKEGKG